MTVANGFFVALAVTISAAAFSSQGMAQNPKDGDYYAPVPFKPQTLTPGQLRRTEQGDYYVDQKMVLSHHREAAVTKCTDGIKFASDKYVTCMLAEGEVP
jgi:hypothetical protein